MKPAVPARPRFLGLIARCHLTWKRHTQRALTAYGLTLQQLHLLNRLAEREYLHPAEIADELYCDRPTATAIIDGIERRAWIARQADPDNAKRVRVVITPAGRRKAAGVRLGDADGDPAACFSADELRQLEGLLERLDCHLGGVCAR